MLQLTVRVGTGGNDVFDYEIRADRRHNKPPREAEYVTVKSGCGPKSLELLHEVLEKIRDRYCTGRIRLCVQGRRIVRDELCQ